MKKRSLAAFILCIFFVLSIFSGCTGKIDTAVSNGSPIKLNGDSIYPVTCDDTLTFWMGLNGTLAQSYENFGDAPIGRELEKQTGIKIEYIHPQTGQNQEQFNIMLASNELCDMVQYNWPIYPGGPDAAIKDDYIYALNDYMEEYAPALSAFLSENNDVDKKIKTDSGNYYIFPFVRGADWLCTYQGLILRSDWLEQTGLSVPKSIAEFENVLNEFKGISGNAPLFLTPVQRNVIMNAYGIGDNFYLDNSGTVCYGPAQSEYKKVLETMNKWYANGLLNPDFASLDSKKQTSSILNGEIGAYYGAVVGGIGSRLDAKSDPNFNLVGITQITENGDAIPEFSPMDDNVNLAVGTAISKNCKNLELAMRYLDFGYTDAGYMLYNFGIEGESYEMVNGEPQFTDLLKNNPDGKSFTQMAPQYVKASYSGSFVQDERYVKASLSYPEVQQAAYDNWSITNMKKHLMPPVTVLPEELDEASNIQANINTYVDEMYLKFVTGREPIESFDKYIAQLEEFGLSKLIAMKQSALERYNNK